jgi:hypothetical protein
MLCPMLTRRNVGVAMDKIVWTDLNPEEQYALAALGAGFSIQVCNRAALRVLGRAGLVRGRHLTPKAKQLRKVVILRTMAA